MTQGFGFFFFSKVPWVRDERKAMVLLVLLLLLLWHWHTGEEWGGLLCTG